jgi:hypothetical protein
MTAFSIKCPSPSPSPIHTHKVTETTCLISSKNVTVLLTSPQETDQSNKG